MKSAVVLKNIIREHRKDADAELEKVKKEKEFVLNDIEELVSKKMKKSMEKIGFFKNPTSLDFLDNSLIEDLKRTAPGQKLLELLKREHFYNSVIVQTQSLIRIFDNDLAKQPHSLSAFFDIVTAFKTMKERLTDVTKSSIYSELTDQVITECFGMVVAADFKYLSKMEEIAPEQIELVKTLINYFNPDGTFKYNEDIATYIKALKEITSYIDIYFYDELVNKNALNQMITLFVNALEASNARIKRAEEERVETIKNESEPIRDEESLEELKRYYRNNSLIAIPEDMDAFLELLDRCNIDERERKYILSLIEERLNEAKVDKLVLYLFGSDLEIYEKSKNILSTLRFNDPDYYMVVESFSTLESICELLNEASDEEEIEYLTAEKQEIMECLNDFVGRHLLEEKISTNNLVFLQKKDGLTYFEEDLKNLDKQFHRHAINLLSKIFKDNCSKFRKILSTENLDYYPYEIIGPGISISFAEIDAGIFIILGVSVLGDGYHQTVKRMLKHRKEIKDLDASLKEADSRNKILLENEALLEQISTSYVKDKKLSRLSTANK